MSLLTWLRSWLPLSPVVTAAELLTSDGKALKCGGCGMIAFDEGFDAQTVAQALSERGLLHIRGCPFGFGE